MKTLTLHCDCGRTRTFWGPDVQEILSAIDASGWEDLPDDDGQYGAGRIPAVCPICQICHGVTGQWESEDYWDE